MDELPMLEKVHLHKPKVDLEKRFSPLFLFANLDDLKQNWQKMLQR